MAWNPDDDLPSGPLAPHERQQARRVLRWYERRVFLRAFVALWAKWLIMVPTAMMAAWGLLQALWHSGK